MRLVCLVSLVLFLLHSPTKSSTIHRRSASDPEGEPWIEDDQPPAPPPPLTQSSGAQLWRRSLIDALNHPVVAGDRGFSLPQQLEALVEQRRSGGRWFQPEMAVIETSWASSDPRFFMAPFIKKTYEDVEAADQDTDEDARQEQDKRSPSSSSQQKRKADRKSSPMTRLDPTFMLMGIGRK